MSQADVRMFLLAHRALRRDFHRLAEVLAAPGATTARLADAFAVSTQMLLLHHQAEDDLVWPLLRERRPDLAAEVDALEAEHHELDALLDAISTPIGSGGPAATAAPIAARLAQRITDHLDREEREIVPAIAASVSAEEWIELDGRRKARLTPEQTALSVAWILSAAGVTERDDYAALLPEPVRALWRDEWAPAFASRTAALLAA
jgi:hypothetical protein